MSASPKFDNTGSFVRLTKLFSDLELHKLNSFLQTTRFTDGIVGLQRSLMNITDTTTCIRGIMVYHKVPAPSTLVLYHAKLHYLIKY